MRRLVLVPDGWPDTLDKIRPGLFTFNTGPNPVGIKTRYGSSHEEDAPAFVVDGEPDAYFAASGEYFWGGAKTHEERRNLIVQPVQAKWIEEDE